MSEKYWFWKMPSYVNADNFDNYDLTEVMEHPSKAERDKVHKGTPPDIGDWVTFEDVYTYTVIYREKLISDEPGQSGWAIYLRYGRWSGEEVSRYE